MSHKRYTRQEDKVIAEYLPKVGYEGVMQMLPGRTKWAIQSRAKVLRERGQMTGMAANDCPVGKPRQKAEPKFRRRPSPTAGMSRHERYMAGESVRCV